MAPNPRQNGLTLPVAVIVGAVIIGASIIFSSTGSRDLGTAKQATAPSIEQGTAQGKPKVMDVLSVKAAGAQVVGSPSAPVTVAYWFDYQCPVCHSAEDTIMSEIMSDYVNTGKIRVVFKDLQFLGPDSTSLGIAARAVGEVAPSKFYEWHKAVYDNQGQENSGWATKEKILAITTAVLGKADADRVMSLMLTKDAAYRQSLDADQAEAVEFGIRATPSFIIGKQLLVGLSSYANIRRAIDAAIK